MVEAQQTFTFEPDAPDSDCSVFDQFRAFDAANPAVYQAIRARALWAVNEKGASYWSMTEIFENLRCVWKLPTSSSDYRLNNRFRRFYRDKLVAEFPSMKSVFPTRDATRKHKGPEE